MMKIKIAFAAPLEVWQQELELPAGSTVAQAIKASDFARIFPEFTDHMPAVGIYGELCDVERQLEPGDRVELYRPLVFDPLETRRRRARQRKKKQADKSTASKT